MIWAQCAGGGVNIPPVTVGPLNCRSKHNLNHLLIKTSQRPKEYKELAKNQENRLLFYGKARYSLGVIGVNGAIALLALKR